MKKDYILIFEIVYVINKEDTTNLNDISVNSYYSDKTYDLEETYRDVIQQNFINYINQGDYNEAYNMLSEKSKIDTFNNDFSNFEKYAKENLFEVGKLESYNVNFVEIDSNMLDEYTEIKYVLNIRDKKTDIYAEVEKPSPVVKILEYSPFKYEIEI